MAFRFFFRGGPLLVIFCRLEAGAPLEPASGAEAFRTREAGGSPTSAAGGVACSNTWGLWSAGTGRTKKKYEIRKADKYLKDNNIVVSVRSICRILGRKVTGAPGVRWTHLMDVADRIRIRVLVVCVEALGSKRSRLLGGDAGKILQYMI